MRKAQTQSTTITIILFFVVAVLLIIFAGRLTDLLNESRAKEVCKISMLASSKTKAGGFETLDIKCKMQVFDIKADGVYENQNKVTSFAKETNIDDAVKRAVADRIADCWYMASEGSINPFGEWSKDIIKNKNLCVLCSRINFDKSVSKKLNINTLSKFNEWYQNTKMTDKETTYYKYAPANVSDFGTKGSYYVIYSVASYSRWATVAKWTGTGAIGGAAITAAGGAIVIPVVGAVPGFVAGFALGTVSGAIVGTWEALTEKNPFFSSVLITTPDSVQNACQEIVN
jgi:hypothetical protein